MPVWTSSAPSAATSAAGQDMTQVLTWEVVGEPATAYHIGVYLLDETGKVVAQHDGPGFDSAQWRAGDRFVTFHTMPPAARPAAGPLPDGRPLSIPGPMLVRAQLTSGDTMTYLGEFTVPEP